MSARASPGTIVVRRWTPALVANENPIIGKTVLTARRPAKLFRRRPGRRAVRRAANSGRPRSSSRAALERLRVHDRRHRRHPRQGRSQCRRRMYGGWPSSTMPTTASASVVNPTRCLAARSRRAWIPCLMDLVAEHALDDEIALREQIMLDWGARAAALLACRAQGELAAAESVSEEALGGKRATELHGA